MVPQDAGVFYGMTTEHDTPCVHPLQAYLDLGAHPERATEAKNALVERRLGWMTSGQASHREARRVAGRAASRLGAERGHVSPEQTGT